MQDGGHQGFGELRGHHEVADKEQGGRGADEGAAVPVQDGDGGGAVHVPVEKGPDELVDDAPGVGYTRPRRPPKPNPKYNPEVFDLSYVGIRKRSRKSIKRPNKNVSTMRGEGALVLHNRII